MKKLLLICAMIAVLACINVMPAHASILLKFNPTDIEVQVGSTFSVDLLADITPNDAILGWGLDLDYDNAQMNLDSLTIGNLWNGPTSNPDGDGLVGLATFPPSPQSGINILLATFDFTCLDVGFSQLDLDVTPTDLTEGFQTLTGFASWSLPIPANVTQNPIPEPATLFLMGTGLAGLVAARRRKKKL